MKKKIYVVCNSHMDPIWLWRLREGRSTWINTCRTVVRMMEKYPFLKFVRSSSICYRWIEECDKELFRKIVKLVEANRWELVGGWVEQSDTIITPGESLLRQAEHGKRYFQKKFGRDVRIAYSVDSFGQNAGLPQILLNSGFDYYAYMRPMAEEKTMPDSFRWRSVCGDRDIVSFRVRQAYCTPPFLNFKDKFDLWFQKAIATDRSSLPIFFFGVGDHGGGIYEEQLGHLLALQNQYDFEFCTLSEYFAQLEKLDLPVVTGELTHHSPGCYSALGDVKEWIADCEKNLRKAEKINLQIQGPQRKKETKELDEAWDKLLFNYFHDVYSGTCIAAAYKHEVRDLCGAVNSIAVDSMERSLCRMGSALPKEFLTEGGVLLWNANSFSGKCLATFDTFVDPNLCGSDFNCLKTADGGEIPLQGIRAESGFGPCAGVNWKKLVILDTLGASEAKIYAYGRTEKKYSDVGFKSQKAWLKKLRFCVIADEGDTWGHGMTKLGETVGYPKLVDTIEMEDGPVVSCLRCIYEWKNSTLQLNLFKYAGISPIQAFLRVHWREKDETLKIACSTAKKIVATISGQSSTILRRTPDICEQPFIDWTAAEIDTGERCGFLAHSLHGYDVTESELRLTVLRPVVYAEHIPHLPHGDEGYADIGDVERSFWIFDGNLNDADCAHLAQERLWHAEHLEITMGKGNSKFNFDRWEVQPSSVVAQSERWLLDGKVAIVLLNNGNTCVTAKILRNGVLHKKVKLSAYELKQIILPSL